MNEFDAIADYLVPLAGPEGKGLLDDAAHFTPPPGFNLVITKDCLVEGVHFPTGEYGSKIAQRLLRTNLSDLAAKAAKPIGYLLSIAWPKSVPISELQAFSKGLAIDQKKFGLTLWGGDTVTTDGPLVVSATLIGLIPTGKSILRSGAKEGDDVWVTGSIGQGYLGLQLATKNMKFKNFSETYKKKLINHYYCPNPRLCMRTILREFATASADISDGLLADTEHIATASSIRITLEQAQIPFDDEALAAFDQNPDLSNHLLTGGDDYEIVFTAPKASREAILVASKDLQCPLIRIGHCHDGRGLQLLDKYGKQIHISQKGYKHF